LDKTDALQFHLLDSECALTTTGRSTKRKSHNTSRAFWLFIAGNAVIVGYIGVRAILGLLSALLADRKPAPPALEIRQQPEAPGRIEIRTDRKAAEREYK